MSVGFHLRGGRILDVGPDGAVTDVAGDVIVADGRVTAIGAGLATPAGAEPIDCRGLVVTAGLIDLHVHLREPGEEYKEDIASGSAAALAGGFAAVCAMPNTNPVNDSRAITEFIVRRAREVDGVRVYPVGAVSKGLLGEVLADIGDLKEAGVVALSDDGKCVMNAGLMRRAMEYARTFDLPVIQHAEDSHLCGGGVMNEGAASTRAGLRGQPAASEEVIVARDLTLLELVGGRYHVAHISTAGAVRLVREAKKRGLPVTCEVTPHHLTLEDTACLTYDTSTKVNPPLRAHHDVEALREALLDGTIDAIATDHAPHSAVEKDVEFDLAAFGLIGLETALPVTLGLVRAGVITLAKAIEQLTIGPARVLALPGGRLVVGAPADLTCIDLERPYVVDPARFKSKARNSPWAGQSYVGCAVMTFVGGHRKYSALG
jgi:dihydroorotase